MSHTDDSIFQTIQQVRTPGLLEEVISSAWIQWSKKDYYCESKVEFDPLQTFQRRQGNAEGLCHL